jgi:ketosteroid isomerase-like protein
VNEPESRNIETVRRYYDGCNSGDIQEMMSTFAPNVTHYFLPSSLPPIHGAEALATNWKWWKDNLDSIFAHDHLLAQGDEVVSEFSCVFTPPGTDKRLISRGAEWYVMRDGKILEVRAYCIVDTEHNVELATFPYAERGYRPTPLEVAPNAAPI